ncbi:hypothetical protein BST61_g6691 [Cercospora zeina]
MIQQRGESRRVVPLGFRLLAEFRSPTFSPTSSRLRQLRPSQLLTQLHRRITNNNPPLLPSNLFFPPSSLHISVLTTSPGNTGLLNLHFTLRNLCCTEGGKFLLKQSRLTCVVRKRND